HRLGASATMGKDWFTKYTLAEALHIRPDEVQRWIDMGWLKSRIVQSVNLERLNFVKDFVFPSSHAELLPVRESKKERAAYEEQVGKSVLSELDDDYKD